MKTIFGGFDAIGSASEEELKVKRASFEKNPSQHQMTMKLRAAMLSNAFSLAVTLPFLPRIGAILLGSADGRTESLRLDLFHVMSDVSASLHVSPLSRKIVRSVRIFHGPVSRS